MNILSKVSERLDAWFNLQTGLGTDRDKTMFGSYGYAPIITDQELTALYQGDAIARKIVRIRPEEMLREGFSIGGPDTAVLEADCKALGVVENFQEAMIWANLYGGSCIYVGAQDGQQPENPLVEASVSAVSFLQIYDKRYAQPAKWYEDPQHPRFGRPETYRLQNLQTGLSSVVHESRLILFRGAHTDPETRKAQNGWDSSVLIAVYEKLRQFDSNYRAAEHLMTDASQAVFKLRGLLGAIAQGKSQDLQTRAIIMDQFRSITRAVLLDAEHGEEFSKVATSFAGLSDVLDRSANLLAAATEIPVTILMGTSPAGLNATGESDIRVWYDKVASIQRSDLQPRLERILALLQVARKLPTKPTVKFPSLWQERPKEKADREFIESETYEKLILNEVCSPEDIVKAKFSGEEPKDIKVDPAKMQFPLGPPAPATPVGPGTPSPAEPPKPPPPPPGPFKPALRQP